MAESRTKSSTTITGLPFGEIDTDRIDSVTIDSLFAQRERLRNLCEPVMTPSGCQTPDFTKTHEDSIRMFIHDVGALYHQILRDLWRDNSTTYRVLDSLGKCFWHSLWQRDLSPIKYTSKIGLPFIGADGRDPCLRDLFLDIMNLPHKKEVASLTGCFTIDDLKSLLNKKLDYLHNLEAQYRQNALIILQVGIGYIGLVLGLAFFLASCILTLGTFWLSN
jgi:hypothetical protein